MADTKISDLTAVTDLDDTDELVLARAGASNKIDAAFLPGFQLDYVEFTAPVVVSATSSATPTDVVSAGALTFDGSTRVCIEFFAHSIIVGASAGAAVICTLWEASSEGPRFVAVQGNGLQFPCFGRRYLTPSSGSRTYKIRAWRVTANGTIYAGDGVGAEPEMMPGYIRITKT